jgi:hypothetical protein
VSTFYIEISICKYMDFVAWTLLETGLSVKMSRNNWCCNK